jgi:lipoprotein signal peptidase
MKGISPQRQILLMLLFALGFDQLSKEAARFFGFSVQFNSGVSLNVFSGIAPELLTIVTLLILVGLWYAFAETWKESPVLAGTFFGAGLSNILDRAWYGAVRDWLPIPGTTVTNNLADWLLFTVIFVFALKLIRGEYVE